jgi:hypothetical protein
MSPYADPHLSTMGGRASALPLAVLVFTIVVGVVEEGCKCLAAMLAYRRREFDEPVDGIVYAVTASLGFAAAENIRYFAIGRLATSLICARAFMTVPAHMFFGTIWGYGFGEALHRKRSRRLLFFLVAAISHGTYDALLSTDGAGTYATLLTLGLAAFFIMSLRRSLRFGVTTSETPAKDRKLFPMGNRGIFIAACAALLVTEFFLFGLGAMYQSTKHRVGLMFFSFSAGLLLTFGVLLDLVARALPLDAVADERGLTFAGTTRVWAAIKRTRQAYKTLIVEAEGGDVRVGPGSPEMLGALSEEIDSKKSAAPKG